MILTLSSPSLLQLDLLVYCPLTSPQNKRGDLDLESWEANHLARADPAGRFEGGGGQLVGPRQTLPIPKLGFLLGFRPLYFENDRKEK